MTKRSDAGDSSCAYRRMGADPVRGLWKLKRLTDREKEVLLLVGTGVGNRELARELGIAERTVKAHIARIVEKLGQQTRLQVAMLGVLAHGKLCADPRCACRHVTANWKNKGQQWDAQSSRFLSLYARGQVIATPKSTAGTKMVLNKLNTSDAAVLRQEWGTK